jgi:hypothetical protein
MVPRNIHQTRQGKTKTKPTFRETLRSETIAPEKLFIFFPFVLVGYFGV